jgi:phosphatidylserine/phosphatidylglycerophosphate/cardiolipin synthase-like enzyme
MNHILKKIIAANLYFYVLLAYAENQTENLLPSAFGRTHFIVGMPPSDIKLLRETGEQNGAINQVSTYRQAYFSPDDGLAEKLIYLIDHEQESMQIAVFQFTNIDIARAIKRAYQRGVKVEIITDPLCLQDKFNKITWLSQEGITIYVYNPDASKTTLSNKMHNKFLICGKNIEDKKLIWMGSFNFTKSADTANQESVVVLDDRTLINQFAKQYAKLKERSVKLQDFAKNHFIIQAWKPKEPTIKESHPKTSIARNQRARTHKRNQLNDIAIA